MFKTMMEKEFIKMESLGNDFVIFKDNYKNFSKKQLQFIADRHFGIGCDQIIFITPIESNKLDMFVFNCDGSVAESCGNAIRCVALLTKIEHGIDRLDIKLVNSFASTIIDGEEIETNMGKVSFLIDDIVKDSKNFEIKDIELPFFEEAIMVNVGNPHIVYFSEKEFPATTLLKDYGLKIQKHPAFKNSINVNFAKIINKNIIELKVLERGVCDFTLACGTGAVATFGAAWQKGLIENLATINLAGGSLKIFSKNDDIFVVGGANLVFWGRINL